MKIVIDTQDLFETKTDLLVIFNSKDKISGSLSKKIDQALDKMISEMISEKIYKGSAGETKLIHNQKKLKSGHTLLIGLPDDEMDSLESFRKIGAQIYAYAASVKAKNLAIDASDWKFKKITPAQISQALIEGFGLSQYQFTRYKKPKEAPHEVKQVLFGAKDKKEAKTLEQATQTGLSLVEGVSLARDLVNTPAHDMTPKAMAEVASKLKGVKTKVYHLAEIKKMKMGSFLGVARGSTSNPPAFIEMHYKPKGKAKKTIAIIGKGVTFDSGGLSLKPPKFMENMKDDMSGAAAVIGFMSIVAQLQPKVEVWGFVAATENMPDGDSIRPGDVLTAMNGKTIEVLNTDAEGRLTLADAMHYANQKKPDYMLDMATLTGACLVALGMRYSAIMGNDQALVDKLIACSQTTGENLWQLPLVKEYKDQLKSPIADLRNIGGAYAGTITAGLFLEEFVGDTKWVHLDIAGPAWTDCPRNYEYKGGTGVMVRTLAEWIGGI